MVRKFGGLLAALLVGLACGPGYLGIGYAAKLPGVISYQGAQDAGATLGSYPSTISGTTSAGVIRTLRVTDDGEIAMGTGTGIGSSAAASDDTANPTAGTLRTFPHVFDGTTWDRWRGNSAGGGFVQGSSADNAAGTMNPLVIAGTSDASQTGTANALQAGGFAADTVAPTTGLFGASFGLVFDGTDWDRVRTATSAANTTGTGVVASGLMVHDGTNFQLLRQNNAAGDGTTSNSMRGISTQIYDWNGANLDRRRNNVEANIITAAAVTTDQNSADIVNYNAKGVVIYTSVSVNPGGGDTLTINLQAKDEAGNDEYITLGTTGAVYGAGTTGLELLTQYPGAAETAAVANHVVMGLPLPRTFRINVDQTDTSAWTYKVSYSFIN